MINTIAERVAAGATFLDQAEPGWWQHIDIKRLDLESTCNCVLGQLDGNYHDAVDQRQIYDRDESLGFTTSRNWEWGWLTIAWRDLIHARRESQP